MGLDRIEGSQGSQEMEEYSSRTGQCLEGEGYSSLHGAAGQIPFPNDCPPCRYIEVSISSEILHTIPKAHLASNKQSSVLQALNDLNERHQRLEILSVNEPERLKKDILAAMGEMSSENAKQKDLLDLKVKLSVCENESSKLDVGLRVLERLHFPMINSRHTNIAAAHQPTSGSLNVILRRALQGHSSYIGWRRRMASIGLMGRRALVNQH